MPRLFISFDRADRDAYLDRFLGELESRVRDRLPEAEFFRDTETLGDHWPSEHLRGVLTSDALLSVCSPRYFENPNCGREFAVFQRRVQLATGRAGACEASIFPVLWGRLRGHMPGLAGSISFGDANFPQEYTAEGLRYIAKLRTYRPAYEHILSTFAERIAESLKAGSLPPLDVSSAEELPNAFSERLEDDSATLSTISAKTAVFSFAAGTAEELRDVRQDLGAYGQQPKDWRPFGSGIGILAQRTTAEMSLAFREIPLWRPDSDTLRKALETVSNTFAPMILICDPWSMALESLQPALKQFDVLDPMIAAVIVAIPQDQETARNRSALESIVQETLRYRYAAQGLSSIRQVSSDDELRPALVKALTELRLKRIEQAVAVKAIVDAGLERDARSRGVAGEHLPVIGFRGDAV